MTRRVVVSGNLSLDDTVTPAGSLAAAPGGDALYASLGVRFTGATPILLTLVGDDYPDEYVARIAAAGIDLSWLRRVAGASVHYRVTNHPDGARTYEWISDPERLLLTSPGAGDYSALASADWIHIAAMPIEAQEVAVAAARSAGLPYSLDPHEEYVVGFEPRLLALVDGAVFMPSELELRLLFPDLARLPPVELAHAALDRLEVSNPAFVVVKLGELGSIVRFEGRTVRVAALPVAVVDSTGAGDAYCGGFVGGWLATRSPEIAAGCGTVAAAAAIGQFGALPAGPGSSGSDRFERVRGVVRGIEPPNDRARLDRALAVLREAMSAEVAV